MEMRGKFHTPVVESVPGTHRLGSLRASLEVKDKWQQKVKTTKFCTTEYII
jgi:hypothetical protein